MVRPASSNGKKWDRAFRESVEDAKEGYEGQLAGLPDKIIAAKADAIKEYTRIVNSASYDANVRAGLTAGVADVNYGERLDQISESGFADFQQNKLVQETVLRRHLAGLLPSVIALATGASGKLKLPNVSDSLKRTIVNSAMMEISREFSTGSTAAQVATALIANADLFDDITVGA